MLTYSQAITLAAHNQEVGDFLVNYDWPCPPGQSPLYGQKYSTRHMLLYPRSFVLSDTRAGKSRPALWACDWLMSMSTSPLAALIVSDILALEDWALEIDRVLLGRRNYVMLSGTVQERIEKLEQQVDFYLINHDGMKIGYDARKPDRVFKALLERRDIAILIYDEATTYRQSRTRVSKAAGALSRRSTFVWAMTGTPDPNGPLDAYGLKKLVHPYHDLTFTKWRDQTCSQKGPFKWVPRPEAVQLVDALLSPAVRIARAFVFEETELHLPPPVMAPLSTEQVEYMKRLKRELVLLLKDGGTISAVNQGVLRLKIVQIATGRIYTDTHEEHTIDASPRLALFDKLIGETTGKTIVFAPFISVVKMLYERHADKALWISGTLSRKAKVDLLRTFQRDKNKTLLCSHPGPVARGLDLTVADTIVWFSPIERTEFYLQSNQRINGPAQKSTRNIIRISGSIVENEIYRRLETNESLMGAVLKLKEFHGSAD